MSRILADLLGAKNQLSFKEALHALEAASGHPNEDIRCSADISRLVHQKTKELGLDPRDSTERELFHSLQGLVKVHDEFLARALGIRNSQNGREVLERVVANVRKMDILTSCWALKTSVAKSLIKATPPKRLMKYLGYKSIDSMLKRENIADIFATAYCVETPTWVEHITKQYRHIKPSDFERRKIEIRILSDSRWVQVIAQIQRQNGQTVLVAKELGVIITVPPSGARQQGFTTALLSMLIHAINHIRSSSAFVQLHQVKPHFGRRVQEVLFNSSPVVAVINNQPIQWRSLQQHLARAPQNYWPEVFEPHLAVEDISWLRVEDTLYKIEPALKFWKDLEWVGKGTGPVVSFSLLDNSITYANDLPYGQHSIQFMQEDLGHELIARYLAYEGVRDELLTQLDDTKLSGATSMKFAQSS